MNTRSVKKIGAFTAFSMLVGSVVGIGIFLKNNSVFRGAGYNPTNVLVAWIAATIICLVTALSYSEISLTAISRLGLAKWSEKVGGKKLSSFFKIALPLFYYGLLLPGISYFAAEILLLNFASSASVNILADGFGKYSSVGLTIGIGSVIYLLFLLFNYLSLRLSGYFQNFSVIIKFIPLIAVVIVGIVAGAINSNLIMFNRAVVGKNFISTNNASKVLPVSFNSIIVVLPAILFAFDSFLNVGSLTPVMKNPRRIMPFVLGGGMIVVGVTYILITIGQIFVSQGISWNVFNAETLRDAFGVNVIQGQKIASAVSQTFFALILVSVLGVVNGFVASQIRLFESVVLEKIIFGSHFWMRLAKNNAKLAGVFLALFVSFLWTGLYVALSFGYNSDIFIDGLTNFPTLFFFFIYGLLPLLAVIQRVKYGVKRDWKFWKFTIVSLLSTIGCFLIVFYQAFYVFLWKALTESNIKLSSAVGWGGFLETTPTIEPTYVVGAVVFLLSLLAFFVIPLTNVMLVKVCQWKQNQQKYTPEQLSNWYTQDDEAVENLILDGVIGKNQFGEKNLLFNETNNATDIVSFKNFNSRFANNQTKTKSKANNK